MFLKVTNSSLCNFVPIIKLIKIYSSTIEEESDFGEDTSLTSQSKILFTEEDTFDDLGEIMG